MDGLLEGKSALISGGGGGSGRATALIFAREGARLAIADAVTDAAEETVALVNAAGGQAIAIAGDVTESDTVRAMVAAVVSAYGRLDCAFNNAGIAGYQVGAAGLKTHEWADESFDRMIGVNLKGVWLCMKHEIIQMLAQGAARRWAHRQHGVDRGVDRVADVVGLCRVEARRVGFNQDRGSGIRDGQYPGERGMPRIYRNQND